MQLKFLPKLFTAHHAKFAHNNLQNIDHPRRLLLICTNVAIVLPVFLLALHLLKYNVDGNDVLQLTHIGLVRGGQNPPLEPRLNHFEITKGQLEI